MLKQLRLAAVTLALGYALVAPSTVFGFTTCSPDQERAYRTETPYPSMMFASRATTLGTTLAAWAVENKSGMHNPAWAFTYGLVWFLGALDGPSCLDVPSAYIDDGLRIAEERSALPVAPSDHSKMLRKFASSHIVNLLILSAVYIDNDNPTVRTASATAALSPIIGFAVFEWRKHDQKREWAKDRTAHSWMNSAVLTSQILPSQGYGHDRLGGVMLGISVPLP